MSPTPPDIEIYIKRATLPAIADWLARHFEVEAEETAGATVRFNLKYQHDPLQCTVFEKAAKGGYVSVLFEPNRTPWSDDEACARDAFDHFGLEIRCVVGGWTPDSDDAGGWYRFTDSGQSVVNWLT